MAMRSPLPVRDGVGATRLHVPMSGPWPTVSAYMAERFFHLDPERLLSRFDRGEIVAFDGSALTRDTPLGAEEFVWYYREPPVEVEIPFDLEIVHHDDDLLVVDKPHFLPTTPAGKYVQNSALVRLRFLTSVDFPPFNFTDQNGKLAGFNVDLAREICNELEIAAKCEIQALPFADMTEALTFFRGATPKYPDRGFVPPASRKP